MPSMIAAKLLTVVSSLNFPMDGNGTTSIASISTRKDGGSARVIMIKDNSNSNSNSHNNSNNNSTSSNGNGNGVRVSKDRLDEMSRMNQDVSVDARRAGYYHRLVEERKARELVTQTLRDESDRNERLRDTINDMQRNLDDITQRMAAMQTQFHASLQTERARFVKELAEMYSLTRFIHSMISVW